MTRTLKALLHSQVVRLALFSIILVGLTACGEPPQTGPTEQERADALVIAVKGHESWPQHPKFKGIQESSDGTHGTHVQIWFNDIAAGAMGKFSGEYPDGSIFVKRGYEDSEGKKPRQFITIMQKIKDYDAANGGWYTLRIWDNNISPLSGWQPDKKVAACVGCHTRAKEKHDYILMTLDFKFEF